MTTFTIELELDYIRMGDLKCRPTPSHWLNAYCTVIVRVSYGYGYTRGSGRVWVASSARGTGRVAKMVDPNTPKAYRPVIRHITRSSDEVTKNVGKYGTRVYACLKVYTRRPIYVTDVFMPTVYGHFISA